MKLTILNDVHLGAIRSAGTTPATQWGLRQHALQAFKSLLPDAGDLLIQGDLFDTSNVPIYDVLEAYTILADWLAAHPSSKLYNVMGNHDASKTSNILSSFQFLGRLLSRAFAQQYVHIEEAQLIPYGYVIPHCVNQDLFNMALENVPECDFLFLHCNVDNGFAAQSDQSLNISLEQVSASPARHLVVAHEHHGRVLPKVTIPGNQLATSVSDWLAPANKQLAVIENGILQLKTCAVRSNEFAEIDWQNLTDTTAKFVRVVGEAQAEQAADVVNAVNKLRKSCEALVITNAVTIHTDDGIGEVFSDSLESVQQFDIMVALRDILTADEMAIVEQVNA